MDEESRTKLMNEMSSGTILRLWANSIMGSTYGANIRFPVKCISGQLSGNLIQLAGHYLNARRLENGMGEVWRCVRRERMNPLGKVRE